MRPLAVAHVVRALGKRRKSQPGSQRGRFRPALTWRRPLSAGKRCPGPSRGRDAPPSVVGFGTWQVRLGQRRRPRRPRRRDGGGSGRAGTREMPGRLCGGGEARAEGAAGPGATGAARSGDRAPALPRGRESPPGPGDTAAGGISAPAAGLSPPLDPARRPAAAGGRAAAAWGEVRGGAGPAAAAAAGASCAAGEGGHRPHRRPFIHSRSRPAVHPVSLPLSAPDRQIGGQTRSASGTKRRRYLSFLILKAGLVIKPVS